MAAIKKEEESPSVAKEYDNWLSEWTDQSGDVKQDQKVTNQIKEEGKLDKKFKEEDEDYFVYSDTEEEKVTKPKRVSSKKLRKDKKNMSPYEKMMYLDALILKLCQKAPTSGKVSNMCLFKCFKCGDTLTGWNPLKRHFTEKHRSQKLSMLETDKFMFKAVGHKCKLCSSNVLCDSAFIQRHLTRHKIGLSQYAEKFATNAFQIVPNTSYSQKIIGNLCVFNCIDCGQKSTSSHFFSEHKKLLNHSMNTKAMDSLTKKVYHKCKLCNKTVLCDQRVLQKHFKRHHDVSVDEYCQRTGTAKNKHQRHPSSTISLIKSLKISQNIDNSCIFACDKCDKKFFSVSSIKKHIKQHNFETFVPLSKYLIKGFSYQCEKCSLLLLCDITTIKNHMRNMHGLTKEELVKATSHVKRTEYDKLSSEFIEKTPVSLSHWSKPVLPANEIPIQEVTDRIGNLCKFRCPFCNQKEFSSWASISSHCKSAHKCGIHYSPASLLMARCHACLMCPKVVLCDRVFLAMHVRTDHKRSILQYEKIFKQNGGETLPTFITWMRTNCDVTS